jgi:hypothetical protein
MGNCAAWLRTSSIRIVKTEAVGLFSHGSGACVKRETERQTDQIRYSPFGNGARIRHSSYLDENSNVVQTGEGEREMKMKMKQIMAFMVLGMTSATYADSGLSIQSKAMRLAEHQMDAVTAGAVFATIAASAGAGGDYVAYAGTRTDTRANAGPISGVAVGTGTAAGAGDGGANADVDADGGSTYTTSVVRIWERHFQTDYASVSAGAVGAAGVNLPPH